MTYHSSHYLRLVPFHALTVEARYHLMVMRTWFPRSNVMKLEKVHKVLTMFGDIVDSRAIFKELLEANFVVLGKNAKGGWMLGLVDWFTGVSFPDTFIPFKSGTIPYELLGEGTASAMWVKQAETTRKALIDVSKEIVNSVFIIWRDAYRTSRYKIKREERRLLTEALVAYSPEYLIKAIKGMQYSEWHMGENSNHIKYDKITHVVRNIEPFATLYDNMELPSG